MVAAYEGNCRNQAIAQLCAFYSPEVGILSSIKREVKKKVLPRPEWRLVSRDPAHVPLASLQVLSLGSHKFLCYRWRHRVERATSEWWLNVSTMVLSEARGL